MDTATPHRASVPHEALHDASAVWATPPERVAVCEHTQVGKMPHGTRSDRGEHACLRLHPPAPSPASGNGSTWSRTPWRPPRRMTVRWCGCPASTTTPRGSRSRCSGSASSIPRS